jgi:hypothetical protein
MTRESNGAFNWCGHQQLKPTGPHTRIEQFRRKAKQPSLTTGTFWTSPQLLPASQRGEQAGARRGPTNHLWAREIGRTLGRWNAFTWISRT